MSKIFVRERKHVGEGAGRPRFSIVAVLGADLHVYHTHTRRAELEKLAEEVGADVVYLPRGEHAAGEGEGGHKQHRRRTKAAED
jgi:hypothetical protein